MGKSVDAVNETGRIGAMVTVPIGHVVNRDIVRHAHNMVDAELGHQISRTLADGRRYTVQFFPATERRDSYQITIDRCGVVLLWHSHEAEIGEWCDVDNMSGSFGPSADWHYEKYNDVAMCQRLR